MSVMSSWSNLVSLRTASKVSGRGVSALSNAEVCLVSASMSLSLIGLASAFNGLFTGLFSGDFFGDFLGDLRSGWTVFSSCLSGHLRKDFSGEFSFCVFGSSLGYFRVLYSSLSMMTCPAFSRFVKNDSNSTVVVSDDGLSSISCFNWCVS